MSDLANVLEEHSEEILQEWIARVREHLAPGDETHAELQDHIPQFLRQLQRVLRGQTSEDHVSPVEGTNTVGREHGAQRFRLGFQLGALVREYGVLRDLLTDLILQRGLQVSLQELRLLTDFVATAIAEAVDEHSQQQARARHEEQEAQNARLSELLGAVRRSEAWLSTVLRSIGDAVIATDVEGRVIFLNPVAEALTGWSGPEARGQPLARIFPLLDESSRLPMESPLHLVLRDGQTRKLTHPALLVRKDGTRLPIDDSMAALHDAEGTVFGVVLIFQDVSDKRRQAQETERLRLLAEGERARLQALIHQAPAAIAVLRGQDLVFESLNRETTRVWGRAREQLEGRPLLEALPELEGQGFDVLLRRVMDSGTAHTGAEVPVPVRRPDGTHDLHYFNFVYAPWWTEPGAASGVIVVALEVTEAVRARHALQAERERAERARTAVLDALAAQNLVAVNYLLGPEHVFERANPLYARLVEREVLDRPFLEALPELEEQGIGTLLDEVFQSGSPRILREMPIQVHTRDGAPRERLYDFVLQPVRDAEGQVEGILNLAIDATAQVRARQAAELLAEQERARRDAETRLRRVAEGEQMRLDALFRQAPVAITVLRGPLFIVELANPPILRIWGRTSAQVLGRPILTALSELRDQGFEDLLQGVLTTGVPFVATEMELRFARGEGGTLETGYFNFVYAPLRDEQGEIGAVLAVATEVTEAVLARRQVEELLRRSQEAEQARTAVLDALSAQTLIAVCYQRGPELVYETANPLFRQISGREVVGLSQREAFPELEDHQETAGRLMRVYETGEPYVAQELRVPLARWRGGPVREGLFDLAYQPVKAPGGGVEGVLTLLVEVTEQVRLRQAAQRLAEEERERRDLEQHLIGIVSHDLRNPLSAILLGLQLLARRSGLDARILQSLVRIQTSAERAMRMVKDLLDFTQARLGGGLKIQRAPTDIHALVRGAVEEHQVTHPERELRLVQKGAGGGEWDADRITQLMGNLLGNALKYSPPGSPVTVRSASEPDGVRLEVHNGGAPIPPEAQERLFQPLQRAVQGVDTVGRSVGLGLYIVAQIVRAHGGNVQVHSAEGEGTTFRVQLPRFPVSSEAGATS